MEIIIKNNRNENIKVQYPLTENLEDVADTLIEALYSLANDIAFEKEILSDSVIDRFIEQLEAYQNFDEFERQEE